MEFTADDIRQLRYRLGWSQAEMARCLKLELSIIAGWESGTLAPQHEHRNSLCLILHQAEHLAEKIHRRPIAEVMMRKRGLSQIHDLEVVESLDEESSSTESSGGKA